MSCDAQVFDQKRIQRSYIESNKDTKVSFACLSIQYVEKKAFLILTIQRLRVWCGIAILVDSVRGGMVSYLSPAFIPTLSVPIYVPSVLLSYFYIAYIEVYNFKRKKLLTDSQFEIFFNQLQVSAFERMSFKETVYNMRNTLLRMTLMKFRICLCIIQVRLIVDLDVLCDISRVSHLQGRIKLVFAFYFFRSRRLNFCQHQLIDGTIRQSLQQTKKRKNKLGHHAISELSNLTIHVPTPR